MKNLLYFILIVVILGLGYLKFQSNSPIFPGPSPMASPTASASPSSSAGPVLTVLETPYFTLDYPLEASAPPAIESQDFIEWRITYMGTTQKSSGRTQTELFDGYAMTITRFEAVGVDLGRTQADADRQGILDACGEENLTPLTSETKSGRPVLTFFGGCLGEATYYYFEEDNILYRVTEMVVGPVTALAGYQSIVDAIFASLKFTK